MKIFMTGSDGFIGSHLMSTLQHHEIQTLAHDLREHKKVEEQIKNFQPDIVVHLAARTEVEQSFYEQLAFSEINYVGTINLIESCHRHCPNLKNFIFASTMEVYGWQPISDEIKEKGFTDNHVAFDENTQPNPNAPYAVAKYGCEKYLQYAHRSYNFPFTALRQTNTYGRKQNDFFVTETIIHQMLKNKDEVNLGYAKPYRNFLFIEDLLEAWSAVINDEGKNTNGKIYTLGPDNVIQIEKYADKIAGMIGWNGKINWDTRPARPGEIFWLNSNHDLITKDIGWTPKTDLDTGLDLTIRYWKEKNGI